MKSGFDFIDFWAVDFDWHKGKPIEHNWQDFRTRKDRAIALGIHKVLQSAATDLEKKKIEVQIVCKGRLVKGDLFWVEYRGETLPLDFIFGTPRKQEIKGFPVYTVSFNLSS